MYKLIKEALIYLFFLLFNKVKSSRFFFKQMQLMYLLAKFINKYLIAQFHKKNIDRLQSKYFETRESNP